MQNMKHFLLTFSIVLLVFNIASAVTLENETSNTQKYTLNGKIMGPAFAPSESRSVKYYSDNANLTISADTPYHQIALATNEVTGTTAGTEVTVNLKANFISIRAISGTVNVFSQDKSNTPALVTGWTDDNGVVQFNANGTFNKLVVTGTGTCRITQYQISN